MTVQGSSKRIALFVTCLADTLYPDVGRAAVTLLERLGHRVEFLAAHVLQTSTLAADAEGGGRASAAAT